MSNEMPENFCSSCGAEMGAGMCPNFCESLMPESIAKRLRLDGEPLFTPEPIDRDYCTPVDAELEFMLENDSIGGC